MKIGIIGTGGVGGYFGGKLALAGHDVIFIARGAHLNAIQQNGLQIKSFQGEFTVKNAHATDNLEELKGADVILLTTKAWQIKDLAPQLKGIVDQNTILLPLQNGVLSSEELLEEMPDKHIMGGLCRIISMIESPGVISHIGVNPTITFGELNNTETSATVLLKQLFEEAGIEAYHAKDIQADRWKKFISICLSGLLALTRTNYGELRTLPETRELMIQLVTEVFQVAKGAHINLPSDFVEKTITVTDSLPFHSNSSMARDIWQGKPSELEYQNGTVVRLGKKYGVPTPVNAFVYNCLLPMELKARNK
ncbi:ketopantoate reductase family protein [Microbacter margulisiae]|uniref:2-dehydropantoate 2-reductase n=1 Tax=Microbacter margulisiae TaxID=1350067 RepID=A0A7W5DPF4_9PORP|nr:2-dehydropantoate 2-reductase [Microbacter margulisiae]MBB3186360.1 2-dehydropantoate 2-reductase [Microbacter margulisiae]